MTFFNKAFLMMSLAATVTACDGRKTPASEDEGLYGGEDVTYAADSTFRVESVSLAQTNVQSLDMFGLPESKVFQFKACLTDLVSRAPIVLTRFGVSDGSKERIIRTDTEGCLIWDESHKISALQKERLLKFRRHFRGVQSFTGDVTVELAMNPWESSPTLYDLRRFTPPDLDQSVDNLGFESDMLNRGLGPNSLAVAAEAFLADVSMEFTGHDKKATIITKMLTLKPAQKFRLRLEPKFVRRNLQNELIRLDLKGGEFRVKLVVVRDGAQDDPQPADLVAEFQGNLRVLFDGTATQDILLRIHDTAKILSRNHVLIVLEPMGEAARVARVGVYSGFIGALKGNDATVRLISAEDRAALMASRIENLLELVNQPQEPLRVFSDQSGLRHEAGAHRAFLGGAGFPGFDGSVGDRTLEALCARVYRPEDKVELRGWFGRSSMVSALAECRRMPSQFIQVGQRDFVVDLKGIPRNLSEFTSTQPREISISRSLNWTKSSGTSAGGRLGLSLNPLDLLGIKIGIGSEVFVGAELTKSSSSSVSANVSETQSFSVVRDVYEVDAVVRSCLVVQGLKVENRGFYSCQDETKERTLRESYYLVNYNVASSPFADDLADNQWRLTIRGDQVYQRFERLLTAENSLLTMFKLRFWPEMDRALVPDFKVNQVYPGVASE